MYLTRPYTIVVCCKEVQDENRKEDLRKRKRGHVWRRVEIVNVLRVATCLLRTLCSLLAHTMADTEELFPIINIDSPDSDNSSDEDGVNTAGSRVYMGPLKSPEKKLASQTALPTPRRSTRASTSTATQSPLRRSSRLSAARVPSPTVSADDHDDSDSDDPDVEPIREEEGSGRAGTPEKETFVDDGEWVLFLCEVIV